jgi:DNA-binding MarR family transcriptional regulator
VLRILRGSGDDGRPATEIGPDMVVRVPDVTRLVDRLERDGYVERTRCSRDRRVVWVCITQAGLDLLKTLDPAVLDLHKAQLGHLTQKELSTLSRLLTKARHRGD